MRSCGAHNSATRKGDLAQSDMAPKCTGHSSSSDLGNMFPRSPERKRGSYGFYRTRKSYLGYMFPNNGVVRPHVPQKIFGPQVTCHPGHLYVSPNNSLRPILTVRVRTRGPGGTAVFSRYVVRAPSAQFWLKAAPRLRAGVSPLTLGE